ncbi:MAG: bifunctional hydroxymethylpyrimidine kinase/phosphomethylpyrimidine kinase [Deltaproteobacteria bacterium RIFCSPLOWO2_02_FULL_50_16]|nr:MAG: bifunctional hydroxymethylpyrimidine kinase/phosphomethylpyrimidine kinase [Deltaproteobacteria bacterium GWA2_50_8]OGQ28542.1 MAG: bifunctional hydroxymethylpyrimidine kinase/phosphomethylpyrimidine kinase [Deltaproteobacteria bacterium RIFCSPHIGHO2_02_FULL_50_15]OGQ57144.1 MAG: bifunctional hydroxymethylpyrimidine kinase/phosphomethylpyrimidine kinase [Deltaproteobacteria bacterium RIFCSPLOWO2_02_FULL_50_16]OGQ68644.1 MAG: bifunctional hydroxymethylpyrimidine kinase/phosphomethylpyrimi
MKTVLTIAGSDPSGGAGIQKDLVVFRDLKVQGLSVITALTAQTPDRFFSLNAVSTVVFTEQLRAMSQSFSIDGIKIGSLASRELAYQTFRFLERGKPSVVVVDPVLKSSSGGVLLESGGVPILTQCIFPLATLVTPNLDEAERLTDKPVRTVGDMERAAKKMAVQYKISNVLIKGGHLSDAPIDVLFDGRHYRHFAPSKKASKSVRGTGCMLSSAIAVYLVKGNSLVESIRKAKIYLEGQLS